jgi:hypothetical protein
VPKAEDCATPADDECTGAIAPCGATTKWSRRFGDGSNQAAMGLALDDAASVIIAGAFPGTADFGGGALTSSGPSDLFLAKYMPNGTHVWSKHVSGNFFSALTAADGLGDVIVFTGVSGLVDFGGGALPGQDQIPELALAKLDPQDGYSWAKRWGVPGKFVYPTALEVTPKGDILFTAGYTGSLDVGCGPVSPPSGLYGGVVVAKLDAAGACVWSKSFGGTLYATGLGVDANGNIYAAGTFSGQADLGGGIVGGNANDPSYIYLAKMNADGVHLYTKTWLVGYPGACSASGIAVDAAGNVVLTGLFGPAGGNPPPAGVNFDNAPLTGQYYANSYLVRLDPNGNTLWSKTFGAGQGLDVALDPNGQIVAVGAADQSPDFGAGPVAGTGLYAARFDPSGDPVGARVFEAGTTTARVLVDGKGNVILAGGFGPTLDLGTGAMTSAGGTDGFVADVGP